MPKQTSHLLQLLQTQSVAQKVIKASREDLGLADSIRFPFLSIVEQQEMKLALLLSLINRAVGGVLLIGPRGTGKTTAVRGLTDLMPSVKRSKCVHGCTEEAVLNFGMDGVCPACAEKFGMGESLTAPEPMRLIELPLNVRMEDVVGGINERIAIEQNKVQLERGILSHADQNVLYIDEVNLLDDAIINAILDAAAQGMFTVRRGPMTAAYRARLFLIGSMNPEEGQLRPQIQDRFGLRVVVRGLTNLDDRKEVYRRAVDYQQDPYKFVAQWDFETQRTLIDVQNARDILPKVTFADGVEVSGLRWVQALKIESHRAEITMFEAARAYAAADGREEASLDDLRVVAPLALKQRQSQFITDYMKQQQEENEIIQAVINS